MHFGYFFGGAGLLSAALFLQGDHPPSWPALMFRVCAILWLIGILDEWHQSWVPERSGNDVGDWLADATGTVVGALTFRRFHSVLA
jgi:VanZ family protein